MVKAIALIFDLVFLVVGILGFVPAAAPDGMLLNIFHVNTARNIVHLASGIIFLFAAMGAREHRESGFKSSASFTPSSLFGASSSARANTFWVIPHNPADTRLHVVLAVVTLFLGLCTAKQTASEIFAGSIRPLRG
jgi:Domain of unknown function (DUF4383)